MNPPYPSSIGPYHILRPLGSGAMGQVFEAHHEHLHRKAALKILSPHALEDNRQGLARFLQEARVLAQLQHPGIVQILDAETPANGPAYLVMELLQGSTLRTWMHEHRPPASMPAALYFVRQIADAMALVHARHIVHRDLKPENIMLSPDSAAPFGLSPKVLDFGIAKAPADTEHEDGNTHVKTKEISVLGTSAYMAPEQCGRALEVGTPADVYALGIIAYELLAGHLPFEAEEDVDFLFHHRRTTPPALHAQVPSVPLELSRFISTMLAKEAAQRPTMEDCRDIFAKPWEVRGQACPFPGLQSFSEAQAELFFGRKTECAELLLKLEAMRLEKNAPRWLQIEGPSGAGKSSLVQAGLLPRLKEHFRMAVIRPSDEPLKRLAEACLGFGTKDSPAEIERKLRSSEDAWLQLVQAHSSEDSLFLLVIEQFEELFTLGNTDLSTVDALLSHALKAPDSRFRLLTTLRSDYLHRAAQAPKLGPLLNHGLFRYYLRAMDEQGLAQVVHGMAGHVGLCFAEGLAERMVRDAKGTDSRLPLLSHTLRSLWLSRQGPLVTHEHYERLGGVMGALAKQAERMIQGLGEDGQERVKWLILDLVQVGRGVADTRRPRTKAEVLGAMGGDREAERVLMYLSGMPLDVEAEEGGALRLIVFSGEDSDPARQGVDLVHETLLSEVPLIRGWIDAERSLLERRADLEVAAHAWEQAGSPADGLPSGTLLNHYQGHERSGKRHRRLLAMASERAKRFLASARRLEARRKLAWRAVGVFLLAALMISVGSALSARKAQKEAVDNLQGFVKTTDEFVSGADWELAKVLYTGEIRAQLLEKIDNNLATLLNQNDTRVRSAVIWTKLRRSDYARQYDDLNTGDGYLREAQQKIDAGLSQNPKDLELLELLEQRALVLSKWGKQEMARGLYLEAWSRFAASVEVLEQMGANTSQNPDHRRTLATSLGEQGDAEMELGRSADALAHYEKAIALLEQNVALPHSNYDGALLASTLRAQGDVARIEGDLQKCADLLNKAHAQQKSRAERLPGDMFQQLTLRQIQISLAALRQKEGKAQEALDILRQVIEWGEQAYQAEPKRKDYGHILCQGLKGAEEAALAIGNPVEAKRMQARRKEVALWLLGNDRDHVGIRRLGQ